LRSLRRRDFGRLVSQGQSYHFAGFKSNQPGYKSVYAGGRRAARDFCRVVVVEASAAVVCIKFGSWGVASGQNPDMLHGTRWVAGIFVKISRCSYVWSDTMRY
jgi:hypothetical protein